MNEKINYVGCCLTGLVRVNNEDNFSVCGRYLPMIHGDAERFEGTFLRGAHTAFAVFDGMGGETHGEAASYLAAKEFAEDTLHDEELALCRQMNRRVLEYAKEADAKGCGTTAVTLCFDDDTIHGFNLGDSRCYRYSRGELHALSTDHAVTSPITRRSRLTQCLGIPEEEFLVEPSLYRADYVAGDIYLLCSDGLTGSINPVKIEGALSDKKPLSEKLSALKELVFQRGAEDNLTMILFEIC